MTRIRIFVSFDGEHDNDLNELLRQQSVRGGSSFEIVGSSPIGTSRESWSVDSRHAIQAADEVVVICGENTHESVRVAIELGIAQEEEKPYLLLWGRRERMCSKPDGAHNNDAMYSWTRDVLESQMSATIRNSKPLVVPESCKRVSRS